MTRVDDLLEAIGGYGERGKVVIDGVPPIKERPRFSNGRVYAKDGNAERSTAYYLKSVIRQPYTGNVALVCIFYRPDRRIVDADNMLKHVCDSANGVLWLDDSQCTAKLGIVELDADQPRTVIAVARHSSTLKRGTDHDGKRKR